MNYLAHARLSFNDPAILLGNMISDFVKGQQKLLYPPRVQAGIQLHRDIDQFTDHHPRTRMAKEVLRPAYRLYSGAFVDVIYDHFLANDPSEFAAPASLLEFSTAVYQQLEQQAEWFPVDFARMFPYMQQHNWLYNYRTRTGISKSFEGLKRRARYISDSQPANAILSRHFELFNECYYRFWPELKTFARQRFHELLHQPE